MKEDLGLDRLLDLDGFQAEIGGGYWVKIGAQRVPADAMRPRGIVYSLTLHAPGGERAFGIDNAHFVRHSRGPAGKSRGQRDHLHRGKTIRPYLFKDAGTLLDDFWREVMAVLRQHGIE
jgi:hypothetical protein